MTEEISWLPVAIPITSGYLLCVQLLTLQPSTAAIDPAVVSTTAIAPDGRFEKLGSGVVHDTQSGLEWYAGPDKNISQVDANAWAAGLKVDGGGWGMLTLKELKVEIVQVLYQKGAGSRNMIPLLETTGWWVWSGEGTLPGSVWALDFSDGRELRDKSDNFHYKRGFAVRSRR
jgi:hypothetical protein